MKNISLVIAAIMVSLGALGVVNSKSIAMAAPNALQVFITNWPSIQKTQEQNKDANGNIKVHEQGTVSVQGNVNIGNWPGNQNVTITNPLTIIWPTKKSKTLGSKDVAVAFADRVTMPDYPQKVEYASYQGKGKLKYLTVVGPRGQGVEIWLDGELAASSDGRGLEAYFLPNNINGWRLAKMDEAYSSFEVTTEYPFSSEIKIYLYKTLTNPFESKGGAHIELEVE